MNHHSFSCQGESHKYCDKPCQDSSFSCSDNGLSIAIVCDGHGGERYFRSDIGSKICVRVTETAIRKFVDSIDRKMFQNKPFTQRKCLNETSSCDKLNDIDNSLRRLFASIILAWNNEVEEYKRMFVDDDDEIVAIYYTPRYCAVYICGDYSRYHSVWEILEKNVR